MIDLTARRASGFCRTLKIIGLGGAGGNALDRMVLDGVNPAALIAANTDAQALTASVAGSKIQLGIVATRGLGSGGDPELGRLAAEEAAGEVRKELDGVDAVFLLAGLGGGTGSGAIPVIAEQAREAGALVIAVVTLPFAFEGKRRIAQAGEALCALGAHADLVICFENDRMGDGVSPSAGIAQAFAAADQTMAQSVAAITALISRRGLIHLGFDDLKAVLRGINARCLFGYGEAEGSNRPFDALARALRNPLMDKGRLLRDCDTVLVQVSGGPELTLNEVQLLMEELNRHVDDRARVLFGTAVDPQLAGRITVTIFSSLAQEEAVRQAPKAAPASVVAPPPVEKPVVVVVEEKAAERQQPVEVIQAEEINPSESEEQQESEPQFIEEEEAVEFEGEEEVKESPVQFTPTAQATLFGDEPEAPREHEEPKAEEIRDVEEVAEVAEAVETPQTPEIPGIESARARLFPSQSRVARPVPGRTLHPSASFLKPQPPKAEPESPVEAAAPEVEVEEEPLEPVIEQAAEPVIEAVQESLEDLADLENLEVPEEQVKAPEPIAPKPVIPERLLRSEPPEPVKKPSSPAKAPLQETLKFEPVTRGRFEKSEPTIVDGQDLDVPTYLRRNIRIRP